MHYIILIKLYNHTVHISLSCSTAYRTLGHKMRTEWKCLWPEDTTKCASHSEMLQISSRSRSSISKKSMYFLSHCVLQSCVCVAHYMNSFLGFSPQQFRVSWAGAESRSLHDKCEISNCDLLGARGPGDTGLGRWIVTSCFQHHTK